MKFAHTIQLMVPKLHTKFQIIPISGCWEMCDGNYFGADVQTYIRTSVKLNAPDAYWRGHNNFEYIFSSFSISSLILSNPCTFLLCIKFSRSLRYNAKSTGDNNFLPCLTLTLHGKYLKIDSQEKYEILYNYIIYIFSFTEYWRSFVQSPERPAWTPNHVKWFGKVKKFFALFL